MITHVLEIQRVTYLRVKLLSYKKEIKPLLVVQVWLPFNSSLQNLKQVVTSLFHVIFTEDLIVYLRILKKNIIFRSEEHTSELQSRFDLVCRLLLEKKI